MVENTQNNETSTSPSFDENTRSRQNIVRETIVQEIQTLRDISLGFMERMKAAKTEFKKQYFKKKLRKNNHKLMQFLVALQSLPSVNINKEPAKDLIKEDNHNETPTY